LVKQTLNGTMNLHDVQRLARIGKDAGDAVGNLADAAWGRRRLFRRGAGFAEQLLAERGQTRELVGGAVFGKCAD
jgi:hypothetical protein